MSAWHTLDGKPYRPHLLPGIVSEKMRKACEGLPCTARISSFIPGFSCASQETVVGAHIGNLTKGMGNKTCDLGGLCAACLHCHNLIDRVDARWSFLMEKYPAAVASRLLLAQQETQIMLFLRGVINIPGAEVSRVFH